ncbi:MAG: hypothetical protein KGI08_08180 [Thaumarchaeota archaeon]|nr:hypothetical protein [Nitrososphaerota archaeon]
MSSFGEGFAVIAVLVSIFILSYNYQFGQNLVVLFGLASIGGAVGIIWYRYANNKWPFK